MNDKYDHSEVEKRIAKFWEDEKIYAFDEKSKKKVYSIDTPPPTVSGFIHVGHAFSYSQADFIARYKRMKGYNVFYPFGFDNNGIPTEMLVEKEKNTIAEKVGREKFIELVGEITEKFQKMYKETWTEIGISVDWSLLYTTIGKEAQMASQLSFIDLYKMGRAYRRETPTIWCPKEKTALSQMELKDKLLKSKFINIKFSDKVTIATTRPELLPACVAIFVNPNDKKNAKLVSLKVKVPLFGQEVEVMADERVNPEKGTGIVMCCTFGDLTDIEWYKAYNLPLRLAIDERGKLLVGKYKGMGIKEARDAIVDDLKKEGYVTGEKEIEHSVNVHERCNTEIEFLVKMQWYIRYLDMKEELIKLGNQLKWHPEYMHVRYDNWVNGLQWDWSISRQRYYGVPFPVWYCKKCNEPILADEKELPVNPLKDKPKGKCAKCGSTEFVPEEDILDTWATSSLTPLINARWASDKKYIGVYPMDLRPQAHDIISFWLFTTIVKCYLHTKKLPWKDAMISGHGLDAKGMPMHKSVGNVIEPRVVIERYGADPLRYWASNSRLGEDSSFQDKDLVTGSKVVNKLWNVARFIKSNCKSFDGKPSTMMDRWILSKAMSVAKEATENFENYDPASAKRAIEQFFWFFADNYIEFVKYRIYKGDTTADYTLDKTFLIILKMLAPFVPYVTEEIYQNLYKGTDYYDAKSIHISEWPEFEKGLFDEKSLKEGDVVQKIIVFVRTWKHDNKMALNAPVKELLLSVEIGEGKDDIMGAMNIAKISKGSPEKEIPEIGIKAQIVN